MPAANDNCAWIQQQIEPYLDHELSDIERATIERHVDSCKSCRQELSLAETTLLELRALPELRCPGRIIEEAAATAGGRPSRDGRSRRAGLPFGIDWRMLRGPRPAMALLLVLCIAVSALLMRHDRTTRSPVTTGAVGAAVTDEELRAARHDVLLAFAYVKKYNRRTSRAVKQENVFNKIGSTLRKTVSESMFPFPLRK